MAPVDITRDKPFLASVGGHDHSYTIEVVSHAVYKYLKAKDAVVEAGYASEIQWQERITPDDVTESHLLAEYAWVVLNGGMREAVVRKHWPAITAAFLSFKDAASIFNQQDECLRSALDAFNHAGKMRSIVYMAGEIHSNSFQSVWDRIMADGSEYLEGFPYLGPATSKHLLKNLGVKTVKPDRHLIRIANILSFNSPLELGLVISEIVDDEIDVVDIVLWRYATIDRSYRKFFQRD